MVLFGTVQRDKSRLRVTARLVNSADGFTIWSDMFERDSKDIFKVQDQISTAIVTAISPELTASTTTAAPAVAAAVAPAASHGTNDLQAYDLYLRGRYFFEKRGEAGLRRALDYASKPPRRTRCSRERRGSRTCTPSRSPTFASIR
jgi:serine/threonine-protein kinase